MGVRLNVMQSQTITVKDYIENLPEDRKKAIAELREIILKNLPEGFAEVMSNGMIGYIVPHTRYPAGYHVDPRQPLPFINLASQKNFIALYHMGLYMDKELLSWFRAEYAKRSPTKLDMGKSCIRFKKPDQIPLELMGALVSKIPVDKWIGMYEKASKK